MCVCTDSNKSLHQIKHLSHEHNPKNGEADAAQRLATKLFDQHQRSNDEFLAHFLAGPGAAVARCVSF